MCVANTNPTTIDPRPQKPSEADALQLVLLRRSLIAMAEEWNRQVFTDGDGVVDGEHKNWIVKYRAAKSNGLKLDAIPGAKPQSLSPGADVLSVRHCCFGCVVE